MNTDFNALYQQFKDEVDFQDLTAANFKDYLIANTSPPTDGEGGEGTGEQLCLWVSVKNRLPTQNDRYLTIDAHGDVNALWFHGTGNTHWYYDNACYDEFDPTNSVVTWLEPYTPSQPVEAITPAENLEHELRLVLHRMVKAFSSSVDTEQKKKAIEQANYIISKGYQITDALRVATTPAGELDAKRIEKEIRFCLSALHHGHNTYGFEQILAEHLYEWLPLRKKSVATTPAGDEWEVTAKENIRRARYFYNKSVELQASLTYERERADKLEDVLREISYEPYLEDIFPPIPKEKWESIHEMLKNNFGVSLDRLSAEYGRLLRKPMQDKANETLEQLKQKEV